MKKLLHLLCAVLLGATLCGAVACAQTPADNMTFDFAGSLQTLYGGEGYPQAVLVAKNSVIEGRPAAVAKFAEYMEGSAAYLQSAQPADVVSLLGGKYAEGLAPSLNAKNLNADVIKNCSVKYVAAADAKEEVTSFLGELIAIAPNFTAAPADAFFYEGGAQAGEMGETPLQVYAPDGAPALALANAIHGSGADPFVYHIVAASELQTLVKGASPAADFCILPVNMASKLLGTGESYKMLGVVTHGNMYFLRSKTDLTKLESAADLASLVGKKVGVVQLDNVPGLTLQAVLKRENIAYQIVDSNATPSADKVNLIAFADATTVSPAMGCDYYLCPEPAATSKVNAFAANNNA